MANRTRTSSRGLRVVVADDNRDAADSLGVLLRLWGFDVSVAYDGATALETAAAEPPDCMFLDINMPRVDGYSVARQIREQPSLSRVKLVALTAYSGPEHETRAWEVGFDYHLVKPADPHAVKELLAMMERVMELAERTEHLAQQNVRLARETKQVIDGAKTDLREMRQEIQGVRDELRGVKDELREVKQAIQNEQDEET